MQQNDIYTELLCRRFCGTNNHWQPMGEFEFNGCHVRSFGTWKWSTTATIKIETCQKHCYWRKFESDVHSQSQSPHTLECLITVTFKHWRQPKQVQLVFGVIDDDNSNLVSILRSGFSSAQEMDHLFVEYPGVAFLFEFSKRPIFLGQNGLFLFRTRMELERTAEKWEYIRKRL